MKMNKPLLIALALLLPCALAAAAPDMPGESGWRHDGDKVERMAQELNLTADQKTQLETILQEQHAKFKALHDEKHQLIAGILTPEQQAKWQQLQQQRRQQRHQ
jgi:periplasmic protein CpxP/Spy